LKTYFKNGRIVLTEILEKHRAILTTHYQQLSLGYIVYINQVIIVGNVYLICNQNYTV
jgi:hypothetical protein